MKNQVNLEEWYRELWDMAINDKLTCDMKISRGQMKNNDFKKIWNAFLEHIFRRGRGFTPREETMIFWSENGWNEV